MREDQGRRSITVGTMCPRVKYVHMRLCVCVCACVCVCVSVYGVCVWCVYGVCACVCESFVMDRLTDRVGCG